jgi:hypothetical protein
LQLIFFGIFLFVSLASAQNSLIEKLKQYQVSSQVLVEILDGLGPFIKASNVELLTKFLNQLKSPNDLKFLIESLKLIKSPNDLEKLIKKLNELELLKDDANQKILIDFLNEFSDPEHLKKLMSMIKNAGGIGKFNEKVMAGMGKVSCFSSGSREPIMEIEAYDAYIKITSITDDGRVILADKGMHLRSGDQISKDSITTSLSPLYDKDCAYFVKYIRRTDSESIRSAVERSVYIR